MTSIGPTRYCSTRAQILYGKLLAVSPMFYEMPVGALLTDARLPALELRIVGINDSFRRLELSSLVEMSDEDIEPWPCVQLICCTQLQAVCVVGYWHPYLHPHGFSRQSPDVLQTPDRIVTRLTDEFFDELISRGRLIDRRRPVVGMTR